jgi:hypothetical protein
VTGRVLPFEPRGHRDFERLLPWYANGTLEPAEQARVHRHLDDCAACRDEVAELMATMQLGAPPASADDAAAADAGWHRMRARLDGERHAPTRPATWRRARSGWRTSAPWLRAALVAQAAALVVLGVAFARLQLATAPRQATYRTLSGNVAHTSRDAVLVIFDARATDADVRALLARADARIVDGPNAAGAWLVATPPGEAARVRDALRASPHVAMAELLSLPAADRR